MRNSLLFKTNKQINHSSSLRYPWSQSQSHHTLVIHICSILQTGLSKFV